MKKSSAKKQSDKTPSEEEGAGIPAAELSRAERRVAEERTAPRAAVIHEAIRAEGEGELRRPITALVWSGMAAGLSILTGGQRTDPSSSPQYELAAVGMLFWVQRRLPGGDSRTPTALH